MFLTPSRLGSRQRPAPQPRPHTWISRGLFALAALLLVGSGISLVNDVGFVDEGTAPQTSELRTPLKVQERRPERIKPPHRESRERPALAVKPVSQPIPVTEPESIKIAALGIDQKVTELGVIGNDLQVPDAYSDIGWWRDGPVPGGKAGAAVMVGHVDSPTGPAVFYQLSGLKRGHEIVVRLEDGSRTIFVVRKVVAYERTKFPSTQVYRSQGKPALHLLTCGGSFDTGANQYNSNVVVSADLVQRIPAPKAKAKGTGKAGSKAGSEGGSKAKAGGKAGTKDGTKDGNKTKADRKGGTKDRGEAKTERAALARAKDEAEAEDKAEIAAEIKAEIKAQAIDMAEAQAAASDKAESKAIAKAVARDMVETETRASQMTDPRFRRTPVTFGSASLDLASCWWCSEGDRE